MSCFIWSFIIYFISVQNHRNFHLFPPFNTLHPFFTLYRTSPLFLRFRTLHHPPITIQTHPHNLVTTISLINLSTLRLIYETCPWNTSRRIISFVLPKSNMPMFSSMTMVPSLIPPVVRTRRPFPRTNFFFAIGPGPQMIISVFFELFHLCGVSFQDFLGISIINQKAELFLGFSPRLAGAIIVNEN